MQVKIKQIPGVLGPGTTTTPVGGVPWGWYKKIEVKIKQIPGVPGPGTPTTPVGGGTLGVVEVCL